MGMKVYTADIGGEQTVTKEGMPNDYNTAGASAIMAPFREVGGTHGLNQRRGDLYGRWEWAYNTDSGETICMFKTM